jgi:predicted solute-binding protein
MEEILLRQRTKIMIRALDIIEKAVRKENPSADKVILIGKNTYTEDFIIKKDTNLWDILQELVDSPTPEGGVKLATYLTDG